MRLNADVATSGKRNDGCCSWLGGYSWFGDCLDGSGTGVDACLGTDGWGCVACWWISGFTAGV